VADLDSQWNCGKLLVKIWCRKNYHILIQFGCSSRKYLSLWLISVTECRMLCLHFNFFMPVKVNQVCLSYADNKSD
jgi:hypothetical protein